jgi:hypothetical protein
MKKIVLPIIIVIILVAVGLAGLFAYRFFQESEKISNILNENQSLITKTENEFLASIEPLSKFKSVPEDELSFGSVVGSLGATKNGLEDFKTKIPKNKNNLKKIQGNQDVEKAYKLQQEYFDKIEQTTKKVQKANDSMLCLATNFFEIENIQMGTEKTINLIQESQETSLLISTLDNVSNNFASISDKFNEQKECFDTENEKIQEIFSQNEQDTNNTVLIFKELSDLYRDLKQALETQDTAKAEELSKIVLEKSESEGLTSFVTQYTKTVDVLLTDIESALKEKNNTVDKINQEINAISSKYGLEIR